MSRLLAFSCAALDQFLPTLIKDFFMCSGGQRAGVRIKSGETWPRTCRQELQTQCCSCPSCWSHSDSEETDERSRWTEEQDAHTRLSARSESRLAISGGWENISSGSHPRSFLAEWRPREWGGTDRNSVDRELRGRARLSWGQILVPSLGIRGK